LYLPSIVLARLFDYRVPSNFRKETEVQKYSSVAHRIQYSLFYNPT